MRFCFGLINGDDFVAARDPLGVKPLYYGLEKEAGFILLQK
jgi:asparagine synthase (glutamine-hydrolysing)